jgi:hypothetical protein
MKFRINKITYEDNIVYEPQICVGYKTRVPSYPVTGVSNFEKKEVWERMICRFNIITQKEYYTKLPTTLEQAEEVIKKFYEGIQNPKRPIIEVVKELEL